MAIIPCRASYLRSEFFETFGENSCRNVRDYSNLSQKASLNRKSLRKNLAGVHLRTIVCEKLIEKAAAAGEATTGGRTGTSYNGNTASSTIIPPLAVKESAVTGGSLNFVGSTDPLVIKPLAHEKRILLVRHGLSVWNDEGRVQGSSDLSLLSEKGKIQALKCKEAISKIQFDRCFSSPISRARSSAELIWEGREEPLFFLDSLREANLLFLEGMLNDEAKKQFPELFKAWREDPANFNVDGVYPVRSLWNEARKAWDDILTSPGERVLVVTHKSILRALICTALGLSPERFRAVDINNGGINVFTVNKRGEPMLEALNLTAHLQSDNVYYDL